MTKSLEHSIKSRYEPKPTAVDISLVEARINDVINKTMFSLIEDLSQPAPPVEDIKKSLATQIAMMLNRVADKTNPVNVQYLVAALLLLQLSTGDDPLMAIARRLSVKGMGQTQKKIKEEIEPIEELSVQKLNQYVNDNHTARRKNLGKLIRTKKDKAEYIKRWDGAGKALDKIWLKKNRPQPVTEDVNYKHKAIDDAHEVWKSQIDYANKIADEMGHGKTPEHVKGSKEQIGKVKEFVDKHPYNRVPNALKMADHAGISDGLAAHFHKALKAVTESGKAKEKPFTQSDRIGRYLSDQRGRPRR